MPGAQLVLQFDEPSLTAVLRGQVRTASGYRTHRAVDRQIVEATLHLKGTTLRVRDGSADITRSIDLVADKLARQVKRHRDKRRKRRESRAAAAQEHMPPAGAGPGAPDTLPAI